jgi:hypothetical protein
MLLNIRHANTIKAINIMGYRLQLRSINQESNLNELLNINLEENIYVMKKLI